MKLIIDAPADQMAEAVDVFEHHRQTHGGCEIGQHRAKVYGKKIGGVYKTTWAVWPTKNGFSMRYLGDDE